MRFVIYGAGAVGGITGALLARAGARPGALALADLEAQVLRS